MPTHRYIVERRYTEFEELHKQLKLKSVDTEQFPAKTVLKWSPKVLEHRRQVFERYLQTLLEVNSIPQCVLRFLEVNTCSSDISFSSQIHLPGTPVASMSLTQPIVCFTEDAFLHDQTYGAMTDVVTSGTLLGFYSCQTSVDEDSLH